MESFESSRRLAITFRMPEAGSSVNEAVATGVGAAAEGVGAAAGVWTFGAFGALLAARTSSLVMAPYGPVPEIVV